MRYAKNDEYILSTGRAVICVFNTFGINEDKNDEINVTTGYDDKLKVKDDYDGDYDSEFTLIEKREIAEYAIKLWKRWAGLQ